MQLRKAAGVLTARHSQHHSAGLPASAARQALAVVIGTGTDAEPHTWTQLLRLEQHQRQVTFCWRERLI